MLFALALTVFFSGYDQYQHYRHQSERLMLEDKQVKRYEENMPVGMDGYEVLHQVLEAKKQAEAARLNLYYGGVTSLPAIDGPEIWIEGIKAEEYDLTHFQLEQRFNETYEINPSGKIVRIRYTKQ